MHACLLFDSKYSTYERMHVLCAAGEESPGKQDSWNLELISACQLTITDWVAEPKLAEGAQLVVRRIETRMQHVAVASPHRCDARSVPEASDVISTYG
jgi:hypothetical protein